MILTHLWWEPFEFQFHFNYSELTSMRSLHSIFIKNLWLLESVSMLFMDVIYWNNRSNEDPYSQHFIRLINWFHYWDLFSLSDRKPLKIPRLCACTAAVPLAPDTWNSFWSLVWTFLYQEISPPYLCYHMKSQDMAYKNLH